MVPVPDTEEKPLLLVGRETERFVYDADGAGGDAFPGIASQEDPRELFIRTMQRVVPSIRAERHGLRTPVDFTYIDCGHYAEACSDLAADPISSRLLALASERQALAVADQVQRQHGRRLRIIKHQMDYRNRANCGVHINTDHRRPHEEIGPLLDSLILALPVLDGPGGLRRNDDGVWFTLNPKGTRIDQHQGVGAVMSVPLRHYRPDRELSTNRHRLSFINSYDTFTHSADILARALQMIMVRVADLGLADKSLAALMTPNPITALRSWMATPFRRLRLRGGAKRNSPEMLLSYIDIARRFVDKLPAWAPILLQAAADVLQDVARHGLNTETRHLDWPIKRQLLQSAAPDAWSDEALLLLLPAHVPDFERKFLELALLDQRAHDISPTGPMYRLVRPEQDAFWGFDDALLDKVLQYPPVAPGRPRFIADFVSTWADRSRAREFETYWERILAGHNRILKMPVVRGFSAQQLAWENIPRHQRDALHVTLSTQLRAAVRPTRPLLVGQRVFIAGPSLSGAETLAYWGRRATVAELPNDATCRLREYPEIAWPTESLMIEEEA